jgi:hypothetical protein
MAGLVMSPPLLGPSDEPHDIPTLPREAPSRNALKVGVDGFEVGVRIAHNGLPEVVDAVADMTRLRKMDWLGSIYSRVVPVTNGVLI